MPKRPREFFNVYARTLFCSETLDVIEDRDYPGAEPYLCFVLRAGPDTCACRRPIPEAAFRTSIDGDEAAALAAAIEHWRRDREARLEDTRRMAKRVTAERNRLRELDEFNARLDRDAEQH